MNSLDDFLRRLAKSLDEIEMSKIDVLVSGNWDEMRAQQCVGEVRAIRTIRDLIPEIQKQTEERTSK